MQARTAAGEVPVRGRTVRDYGGRMHPSIGGGRDERYRDPFVRDTARRVRFLMAAAGRFADAARFIEDLRRELRGRNAAPRPDGS